MAQETGLSGLFCFMENRSVYWYNKNTGAAMNAETLRRPARKADVRDHCTA